MEKVAAVDAALLKAHPLVLKKNERRATVIGHGIHAQGSRELKDDQALAAGLRAKVDSGRCVQKIVGKNGGFNSVLQGVKRHRGRRNSRDGIRSPHIVEDRVARSAGLREEHLLRAHVIEEHIEAAGGRSLEAGVEKVSRMLR